MLRSWLINVDIAFDLFENPLLKEGFLSGQKDQTVNLAAMPSQVRILPPPAAGVVQW